jgi:hypothetical protein
MCKCCKETLTAQELNNELLLAKDNEGRTAWYFSSLGGNVGVLQEMWECGKKTLTAEEFTYKFLLTKDNEGPTSWHYASFRGKAEALQKLWESI